MFSSQRRIVLSSEPVIRIFPSDTMHVTESVCPSICATRIEVLMEYTWIQKLLPPTMI